MYACTACYLDQQSCGCCVMQKQLNRMEQYFNLSYEGMHHVLTESKTALNNFRASRSAFSVALNSNARMLCFGPFPDDKLIPFKHVFINLGDSYSTDTSIFTAPRSGVYSLAVTIYSDIDSPINPFAACANLMVNGHAVAVLPEHKGNDPEDSSTVVVALGLKAGDQVGVLLPAGCVISILLLCLLQASLAVPSFNWETSNSTAGPVNPNEVCSIDKGSCNCCVMLKEVNRLKTHFDEKLSELEQEYVQTVQSLNIIEAGRVAVSVAMLDTDHFMCFGKFSFDKIIPYKHVFINLGDGYSTETGIFTVPRSGVYSLAVTVYSDAGAPGNPLAACASLQVVAGSKEKNTRDQEDSATIVVARQLNAGDEVAVKLPRGCFLCDDDGCFTSLFLLGPLFLSGPAEALTVAETLKEAALSLDKPLDCNKWDCKCAFDHQRGCCCAAKDMFQLEDDSFMRTKHLWFNISALKYRVKELTGGIRVAFKASNIASSTPPGSSDACFGPFNTNVPIPYNHVTLNHNNGYNPAMGVFTAPAAGVYVFSFSVFSQENGRLYYQSVVLELQRGDQVYIELMSGRKLCKFLAENIFTGYMLYPHTNPYIDMYEY
ncbi:hypothetical protein F7725_020917 [Dissostichus mawsoni]|uniref:C1q domain-containing protein n=1 Tax=Dissostichus mawsoni TaxID=36200 RepID=A0A7J5YGH8_DISMA|nr:hypothetical protein F7725_020917 [Dissostichus mawsoni]